ncbi:MAG TPA: thioredoxin family protein [Ornithinibacter sp.]|nr:thioredoxin family protein [Ornithinibacter sp.]
MPSALLLPVLTCAAVLIVSGAAKLRDPESVDRAFTSLGVPTSLGAPAVRRVLPWAEVALGTWLLLATGPALVVVALLTLGLFVAYLVLVSLAVRRPEPVDCGCFGALGDDRVTRVTVWRNALLVLTALLAVLAGLLGHGVISMLAEGSAWIWLAMTLLMGAVAVLVTHRSSSSPVATGAHGGVGSAVAEVDENGDYVRQDTPVVAFLDEEGSLFPLYDQTRRAAHLLVFLSPACGPCQRIAPQVAGWAEDLAPIRVKGVVVGEPATLEAILPTLRGHAWFDPYSIGRKAFGLSTPGAVLVGTDGMLAGGPALGEQDIVDFVAEIREHIRGAAVEVSGAP